MDSSLQMCNGSRMTQTCAIFPHDVLNRNIIIAKSPTCPSLSSSPPSCRNEEMDVARGKGMNSSLPQIVTDCHLLLSPWKAAPRVWGKGLPPSYPVQFPPSNTWALPWLSPTWTRWTWELLLCLWWEYVPPQKEQSQSLVVAQQEAAMQLGDLLYRSRSSCPYRSKIHAAASTDTEATKKQISHPR